MLGAIRFIDVDEMDVMTIREHSMCTDVEWDPTGRYVASITSAWRSQVDSGYVMWSFQGEAACLA